MVWGSTDSDLDKQRKLPTAEQAPPGREQGVPVPEQHFVNGNPLVGPFPDAYQKVVFAMGCFWGAERMFWQTDGVYTTAVGYAGGATPNPSYEEVCSGLTGHTEVKQQPGIVIQICNQILAVSVETGDPAVRQTGTQTCRMGQKEVAVGCRADPLNNPLNKQRSKPLACDLNFRKFWHDSIPCGLSGGAPC